MSRIDEVLELMRRNQAQVEAGRQRLDRASAPVSPVMSGNGGPAQTRALMEMGLGMMAHNPHNLPGQTIGASVSRGFEILDQIRNRQRQEGMEQAKGSLETLQGQGQADRGWLQAAAQLQHAQNGLDAANRPPTATLPNSAKEFEYAVANGFQGSYPEWLDRGRVREAAAAKEEAAAATASAAADEQRKLMDEFADIDNQLGVIDDSIALIDEKGAGGLSNTFMGWITASDEGTLRENVKTMEAELAFKRLQKMRDQSKTGGALGQVSNIELGLLKASIRSLNPEQNEKTLRRNLLKVRQHYTNFKKSLLGQVPEINWSDPLYQSNMVQKDGKTYFVTPDEQVIRIPDEYIDPTLVP
jgi:hypothetical protein